MSDPAKNTTSRSQEAMEKVRVLSSLLSTSVPIEDEPGTFREYTKYKSAFNQEQQDKIVKKIMLLLHEI